MKIVVLGNGLVGRQLAARLGQEGHDAVALGRGDGIDATTGQGLADALAGADVAVDVTNSPAWGDEAVLAFFTSATEHILAAERDAGVGHHVALSIVGADRVPDSGYLRAKVAQERLVQAGPVPWTVVRSAQFFEFVPFIADAGTRDGRVHVTPAHLQPLASADVVARLAEVVTAPARRGTVDVAGPEALGLDELVRRLFAVTGDPRPVVSDPQAPYFGAVLDDGSLAARPEDDAWLAPTTYDAWLRRTAGAAR